MKKITLVFIVVVLLFSKQVQAQNNAATAVAALATVAAIGAAIASIEDMQEQAELTATEWILANHAEFSTFNLKTLDFNGKKTRDLSSTSVISFKIQEFTPKMEPTLDGKKYVLFCFTRFIKTLNS